MQIEVIFEHHEGLRNTFIFIEPDPAVVLDAIASVLPILDAVVVLFKVTTMVIPFPL